MARSSSTFLRLGCLSVCLAACGSPPRAAAPQDEQGAPLSSQSSVPTAQTAPDTAPSAAGPEAEAPDAETELREKERAHAQAGVPESRDVVYRVTPAGLQIDIEGARFAPRATVKKLEGGAFGLELEVTAESRDDRTHSLLTPALGPLSLAATLFDKRGKEVKRYNDRREGSEQTLLLPGNPLTLQRSWPSGEVRGPLWWGQKLRLEVGLWGFGTDGAEGRPVRKLFVVEVVAGNNATAHVTPPEL